MLQLDKKAVSLIISYILLVTIGLSIAGIVFGWLRFYATFDEAEKCDEGVSLNIMDYQYSQTPLELNVTVQNRGRFDVEGYLVRVHNKTGADLGIYLVGYSDGVISPGELSNKTINSSSLVDQVGTPLNKICFVEIQPYTKDENNNTLLCSQVSSRRIDC